LTASAEVVPLQRTRPTAIWRATDVGTLPRYHPAVPTERYGLHNNPGPESQFRCLRHPPDNAEATDQRKLSTKSDADPVKAAPDSLCFVLLVEFERRELDRKRTLALGGPQPHVDFIEAPRFGRCSQS
jgi:hypothetical protein